MESLGQEPKPRGLRVSLVKIKTSLPYTQPAENNFSPAPRGVGQWSSLTYFYQFRGDKTAELLVEQTNLSSAQKTGRTLKLIERIWNNLFVSKSKYHLLKCCLIT